MAPVGRQVGSLIFWGLALGVLCIPAVTVFTTFSADGQRSWYFFGRNDACQAMAAQAVAQTLGAPIEYVVWPGATLNAPYLYRQLWADGWSPDVRGAVAAERALDDAVRFLWRCQFWYGIAFVLAFCALLRQLGVSSILTLASGVLVATNPWYEFQITQVRPELPALLLVIVAALVANATTLAAWHAARPILVGLLLGLAVLTKIQIAPLIPFVALPFVSKGRWNGYPQVTAGRLGGSAAIGIVLISLALGFLRSWRIDGTTYSLPEWPPTAGLVTAASVAAAFLLAVAGSSLTGHRRVQAASEQTLRVGFGAALGLAAVVAPTFFYGGWDSLLTSVNRLLFGIASYPVYGIGLEGGLGWGDATTLAQKVSSFVQFQQTSYVPVVTGNLLVWVFAVVALSLAVVNLTAGSGSSQPGQPTDARRLMDTGVIALLAAALVDVVSTNRTTGGQPAGFYHILSLPLYATAAAAAVSSVVAHLRPPRLATSPFAVGTVTVMVGLMWTATSTHALVTSRSWRRPESPPDAYLRNLTVIRGFAPSFERLTEASVENILQVSTERWQARQRAGADERPMP